jgi:methylenetetrahydrofolate reductase (NADPH)
MTTRSLRNALNAGQFAITAEITPPLSASPTDLTSKAAPLLGLVDGVNVTDGASARAHMDSLVAATLLKGLGLDPILQITCRDRNRIALQSEIVGAAVAGINNLMILTGDDPKKGDQPEAKPVFDLDSAVLLQTAKTIRDDNALPNGRKVGGSISYLIGCADAPIDPKPGWAPDSLRKKQAAGAQFAQTQFCMDADLLRRYVNYLREAGVDLGRDFHLIVGVAPLASAKSARWIRDQLFGSIIPESIIARMEGAQDPKREGREICVELLREYSQIPGVSGAHIMAPLNDAAIPEVVREFRG